MCDHPNKLMNGRCLACEGIDTPLGSSQYYSAVVPFCTEWRARLLAAQTDLRALTSVTERLQWP